MAIEEGQKAPAFSLHDQDGKTVKLADFKGKQAVVLFAYPKAMTPGCTVEAKDFSCLRAEFKNYGATVIGISADSVELQKKFEAKEELTVPLLSDEAHKALDAYGFWGEKTNYGKTYEGIHRTTVVIDKSGTIAKIYRNVKVQDHAAKVLEFVKTLKA